MQLIIDIPDEAYNELLKEQHLPSGLDVEYFIIHGTPLQTELEKITDRIDDCITSCKKQSVRNGYERGIVIGMSGCIDIINEHISELRGENNE